MLMLLVVHLFKLPRISTQTGLLSTVRAAVKADMGLAVTSDWMFWPELQSGEVVRLLEDWELPPIELWAVFPTGRLARAKARAFAEFVEGWLREMPSI